MRALRLAAVAASATCASCYLLLPLVPISMVASGVEMTEDTPIGTPARAHGGLALGRADSGPSWAPADELPWLGIDADLQLGEAPIWGASCFGVGYSDEVPRTSPRGQGSTTTVDFGLGLRHYQAFGPFEPFVGAGLEFVDRRFTYTDPEPGNLYDYSFGGYLEAGASCAITENFSLAAVARSYLGTDQSLAEQAYDADTFSLLVLFCFRR